MKLASTPGPLSYQNCPPAHKDACPQISSTPNETDRFERTEGSESSSTRRWAGALGGALAGLAIGQGGAGAVAGAAGLGSAAVTLSATAPIFKQSIEDGLNGDLLNDLTVTCGTVAAGGFLLSSAAVGGAGLAYAISSAIPGAAPIVGGIVGAAIGAFYSR